ncbi:MAG: hypothetical protein LBB67_07965 [Oscillospiraceae bacterium]|jgi:hypothetical protein|nr:hypothetical protein [Oscillospiraceae bacterium]
MTPVLISDCVTAVTATNDAIVYAAKDTKVGVAFASFFFCDAISLRSHPVSESHFLQTKFGSLGGSIAAFMGEGLTCQAAPLPDGGCAVLDTNSVLHLFRPDAVHAAAFPLEYQNAPAFDIAVDGTSLWYSVPAKNALVQFSLATREVLLRVGSRDVFPRPLGLSRLPGTLLAACADGEAKQLSLTNYEMTQSVFCMERLEKYFAVLHQSFALVGDRLYALIQ